MRSSVPGFKGFLVLGSVPERLGVTLLRPVSRLGIEAQGDKTIRDTVLLEKERKKSGLGFLSKMTGEKDRRLSCRSTMCRQVIPAYGVLWSP